MSSSSPSADGGCSGEPCVPFLPPHRRRDFLKWSGATLGALALRNLPTMAGPFSKEDFEKLIPADKRLSKEWIQSLYQKGTARAVTGPELKYIGMPIGGMACGQLYLGGDGRLWLWHIFHVVYSREKDHGQRFAAMTLGGHYANPDQVFSRERRPVEQGFAIRWREGGRTELRTLDAQGYSDITFRGSYPIGRVAYREKQSPVAVDLEAFSPFIPLNPKDSALPATVMAYTVHNNSLDPVEVDLFGWLENAVCPYTTNPELGLRRNRLIRGPGRLTLHSTAEPLPSKSQANQPDIVFEDFEGDTYQNWTTTGEAFGRGPYPAEALAPHQPVKGITGEGLANTHNSGDVAENERASASSWSQASDRMTGTLTSKPFAISRRFIVFDICGGPHPGRTCVNLLLKGEVVRTATGNQSVVMQPKAFSVAEFMGQEARLQIVDAERGSWGHISLDQIVFTDNKPALQGGLEAQHGYGSMALSLLQPGQARAATDTPPAPAEVWRSLQPLSEGESTTRPLNEKLHGALGESFTLKPGERQTVTFVLTWYFPYLNQQQNESGQLLQLKDISKLSRHYRPWFDSASGAAAYVTRHFDRLANTTRHWDRTWYDSTLPHWLLDRAFIPNDCLATNTVVWFDNGRFYGWEGVECCPGTCQHVWQYAQGLARIFPSIERGLRENIDFGFAQHPNGATGHRADTAGGYGMSVAHDGHCGTIIRAYREHLTSPDNKYLQRLYPRIKKAIEFVIREDKDRNGILEGAQANTLDATWEGPMGWISSLYLATLVVGRHLALEMGDREFERTCTVLLAKGRPNLVAELFNGEYFIHKPPNFKRINTNRGCHIDQVLGQSFLWQVGLGQDRAVPAQPCRAALRSIYRYNFTPDAGGYAQNHTSIKGHRVYAAEGEAGTIMCTWPQGGDDLAVPGMEQRDDNSPVWQGPGGYLDECMNGFEYQVAAHMIFEGEPGSDLVEKGLTLARAVHDRYHPLRRNPFNEIECSDHYSRSMAAYGVFIAACGFTYHGPKGHIGFSPRLTPEKFKAPFTAAEGWGTFIQRRQGNLQLVMIKVNWGQLRLRTVGLSLLKNVEGRRATVHLDARQQDAQLVIKNRDAEIQLQPEVIISTESTLSITIH